MRPVGAAREVAVDVRLISASHRDLAQEVTNGRFRQDLFYRINVIELRLPALRERPEDISLLAQHILQRLAADSGRAPLPLSDTALMALRCYPFPAMCVNWKISLNAPPRSVNSRASPSKTSTCRVNRLASLGWAQLGRAR